MLSTTTAIKILRALRAYQSVRLADGRTGIVLAQLRGDVSVLADRLVLVVPRWELEPVCEVEYTEEDLAWFRKPVTEVA